MLTPKLTLPPASFSAALTQLDRLTDIDRAQFARQLSSRLANFIDCLETGAQLVDGDGNVLSGDHPLRFAHTVDKASAELSAELLEYATDLDRLRASQSAKERPVPTAPKLTAAEIAEYNAATDALAIRFLEYPKSSQWLDPEIRADLKTSTRPAVESAVRKMSHVCNHDTAIAHLRAQVARDEKELVDKYEHCPAAQESGHVHLWEFEDGHAISRYVPHPCDTTHCAFCGPHIEHKELVEWLDVLDDPYVGPIYFGYFDSDTADKYMKALGRSKTGKGRTPTADGRVLIVSQDQISKNSPLDPLELEGNPAQMLELIFDQVRARFAMDRETGCRNTSQRQRVTGRWTDETEVANSAFYKETGTIRQTWLEKAIATHGPVRKHDSLLTTNTTRKDTLDVFTFHGGNVSTVPKQKHARHIEGFDYDAVYRELRRIGYRTEDEVRDARAAAHARKQAQALTNRMREAEYKALVSA